MLYCCETGLTVSRQVCGEHLQSTVELRLGGSGDGTRSSDELLVLEILELETDADFDAVKRSFRIKAKAVHPDVKPGDAEAAAEF